MPPRFQSLSFVIASMLLHSWAGMAIAEPKQIRFSKQVVTHEYYCDGVAAGDINCDGVFDLVAGPFWYEGPAFLDSHAFYEPVPQPREPSPSNSMFSFVHDVNGDEFPDIIVLGRVHKHAAMWYENPGLTETPDLKKQSASRESLDQSSGDAKSTRGHWKSHFMFERVRGESPTLIDINGDGVQELICHWDGRWGWISPDQDDPYAPWLFRAVGEDEGWPQFYHGEGVGDVNGDGRLDLLINDGWYEQPEASGSADTLWRFHRHRFSSGRGGAQMFVEDVDRDGDSDVISAVDAHGWGLAWYEQREGASGARFRERLIMGDRTRMKDFGVAFTQPHAIEFADLNADGHPDIVTGKRRWAHGPDGDIEPSAAPVVFWFEWSRDDQGEVRYIPHQIDADSGVGVQILTVDLNGDSRIDVATSSKLGTFVFRSLP